MEDRRIYPRIIIYVAWLIWSSYLLCALLHFFVPFINLEGDIEGTNFSTIHMLIVLLVVAALIQCLITIGLRYFALIRPGRNGTYNPYSGPVRFLVVGMINWTSSTAIVYYGTTIYLLSGAMWPIMLFGVFGLLLLLYHSPRLSAFKH